jgi:hypothetical protein
MSAVDDILAGYEALNSPTMSSAPPRTWPSG